MVHKTRLSVEQARIKALEEQLKVLELQQKEQELEGQVSSKKFWTRHRNLREAVESAKSGIVGYGKFVKTEAIPAVKGGLRMGAKALREYRKSELKSSKKSESDDSKLERDYKRVMALD